MCDNIEHVDYLQKTLGYSLTGDVSARVFFIWWGTGANGKSIILNLMKEILSSAYQPVSKDVFVKSNNKSGGCEVLELKDCRLATFSETNAKDCLNESLIKMISGNDSITARGLYKNPVTFTPMCKLVLCTNHKPEFNGEDRANTDRVRFIPFNARFCETPKKQNEYLKILGMDKIIIDKYLDEFFSFCVQGSINYFLDQKFDPPAGIKESQDEYVKDQATISNFINDTFIIDEIGLIEKCSIKEIYEAYCREHDLKIGSISVVHDKLSEMFGKPIKQKTKSNRDKTMYKGFSLIPESTENQNDLDFGLN
jgi:putative DNA primase/helicase